MEQDDKGLYWLKAGDRLRLDRPNGATLKITKVVFGGASMNLLEVEARAMDTNGGYGYNSHRCVEALRCSCSFVDRYRRVNAARQV